MLKNCEKAGGTAVRINACTTLEPQLIRSITETDVEIMRTDKSDHLEVQNDAEVHKQGIGVSVVNVNNSSELLRITPLRFMYVSINKKPVKTLIDSGAQIPIIRRGILPDFELKYAGSIYVQGVFGDPIKAYITTVNMCRCNEIICAVVDDLASGHGLILPMDMAHELNTPLFVMPAVTATYYPRSVAETVTAANRTMPSLRANHTLRVSTASTMTIQLITM